jgi:3-isopropylmalate/(R)-2-methylmalate dehydratase small subunit
MGVDCVIAPSYGDIFFNNCFQNGVLPVVLDAEAVETLAGEVEASQGAGKLTVDLAESVVVAPSGKRYPFAVEARRREAMLAGLDEIGVTLRRADEIAAFQARDRERRPWIHQVGAPE